MGKYDSEELVKYLAEQFVHFLETPKEKRRAQKIERRKARGKWSLNWFGLLPVTLSVWTGRLRRRKRFD
ncbi:MAG TPA: YqzE family protein [Bacilli bacterium]